MELGLIFAPHSSVRASGSDVLCSAPLRAVLSQGHQGDAEAGPGQSKALACEGILPWGSPGLGLGRADLSFPSLVTVDT